MFLGYCGRIYVIDLFHLTVSFEFAKIRNLFYSAKYFLYRELNCSLVKKKGASLWDVPLGLYDSGWLWLLNHDFLRHGLFFFVGELGQGDGQDTVFNLCTDGFSLDVLGKAEHLFELQGAEFVTEVVAIFLFLFFLVFFHHLDNEVVFAVDAKAEVVFCQARHGEFKLVVFVALGDVHFGHWCVFIAGAVIPIVPIEKFVE